MFYIFDMKNFDSTEFGKRLGILMTETNMTQSMLAAKIDVSQRAVSKWLNGKSEPSAGALPRRPDAHAAGKYAGDRKTEMLRPENEANHLRVCPPHFNRSGGIFLCVELSDT